MFQLGSNSRPLFAMLSEWKKQNKKTTTYIYHIWFVLFPLVKFCTPLQDPRLNEIGYGNIKCCKPAAVSADVVELGSMTSRTYSSEKHTLTCEVTSTLNQAEAHTLQLISGIKGKSNHCEKTQLGFMHMYYKRYLLFMLWLLPVLTCCSRVGRLTFTVSTFSSLPLNHKCVHSHQPIISYVHMQCSELQIPVFLFVCWSSLQLHVQPLVVTCNHLKWILWFTAEFSLCTPTLFPGAMLPACLKKGMHKLIQWNCQGFFPSLECQHASWLTFCANQLKAQDIPTTCETVDRYPVVKGGASRQAFKPMCY